MSGVVARTGRHRQRYDENDLRLVSGCIPYRMMTNSSSSDSIEVLMVSSPSRDDLVFPKEKYLGVWEYRSKSRQQLCSLEGGCKGYMFALEVTEELDIWPEQGNRQRKWLKIRDAFRLCRYEWMRIALEECLRVATVEAGNLENMKMDEEVLDESSDQTMVPSGVEDCSLEKQSYFLKPSITSHHVDLCIEAMMSSSNLFQFEKEQTVK